MRLSRFLFLARVAAVRMLRLPELPSGTLRISSSSLFFSTLRTTLNFFFRAFLEPFLHHPYLVDPFWWTLSGGPYLVDPFRWTLPGGPCLVEPIWWTLSGGPCLVDLAWWTLSGGPYLVDPVWWTLSVGPF